jgi:hypothetical protein
VGIVIKITLKHVYNLVIKSLTNNWNMYVCLFVMLCTQKAFDVFFRIVSLSLLKAMLHGAIFLATCNAILLLRDVNLPNTSLHYTPLMFFQHIENSSLISLINISASCKKNCTCVTWPLVKNIFSNLFISQQIQPTLDPL